MEADTSSSTMSPADHRFCANTLKKLQSNQHSVFFREPVDPVRLNCPDYFTIITHPMDLSTVQRKLERDEYDSVDAFVNDIRLIFDNCHKYNNPQDYVALEGKKLEQVFDRLLAKRPSTLVNGIENEMSEEEYRRCEGAIKEMKKKKYESISWAFKKPVDASAWGATDYYEIIKRPMDLETLENKFKASMYPNEESFEEDVRLIFDNCYTYNPAGHPVNSAGKQLEGIFEAYWAKAHKKASKGKLFV
ncbi:Bromodomain-containing protein [Fennellomyces sp. T-0311]|nr:Bromodomain-containing protein [Fennellomyces sp. T-0311]